MIDTIIGILLGISASISFYLLFKGKIISYEVGSNLTHYMSIEQFCILLESASTQLTNDVIPGLNGKTLKQFHKELEHVLSFIEVNN